MEGPMDRGSYHLVPSETLEVPSRVPTLKEQRDSVRNRIIEGRNSAGVIDIIDSVRKELRIPASIKSRRTNIWDSVFADNQHEVSCFECWIFFGSVAECIVHNFLTFLALYDLIFVPFCLAFAPIYRVVEHWQVFTMDLLLCLSYFMLAVPLRLKTSIVYVATREEVVDTFSLFLLAINTSGFWLDCFASVVQPCLHAASLLPSGQLVTALELASVLRLCKTWRLSRPPVRDLLLGCTSVHMQLIKLLLAILVAGHVFACIWFYAKVNSPLGYGREWSAWNGWSSDALHEDSIIRSSESVAWKHSLKDLCTCYVRSMKDALFMLSGWGGPNAKSPQEIAAVFILAPASTMVASFILSALVDITATSNKLVNVFNERMQTLDAACTGLCMEPILTDRIRRYHSYLYFHQIDNHSQETLFSGLSLNLVAEVKMHLLQDVLATPFFEGLPPRMMSLLIVSFDEFCYSPEDIIVKKGEKGDAMYMVLKGSVRVSSDLENALAYLAPGNFFGEISLVLPFPRIAWVISATYSMLGSLPKNKFEYILDECPTERKMLVGRIIGRFRNIVPDLDLDKIVESGDSMEFTKATESLLLAVSKHDGPTNQSTTNGVASEEIKTVSKVHIRQSATEIIESTDAMSPLGTPTSCGPNKEDEDAKFMANVERISQEMNSRASPSLRMSVRNSGPASHAPARGFLRRTITQRQNIFSNASPRSEFNLQESSDVSTRLEQIESSIAEMKKLIMEQSKQLALAARRR